MGRVHQFIDRVITPENNYIFLKTVNNRSYFHSASFDGAKKNTREEIIRDLIKNSPDYKISWYGDGLKKVKDLISIDDLDDLAAANKEEFRLIHSSQFKKRIITNETSAGKRLISISSIEKNIFHSIMFQHCKGKKLGNNNYSGFLNYGKYSPVSVASKPINDVEELWFSSSFGYDADYKPIPFTIKRYAVVDKKEVNNHWLKFPVERLELSALDFFKKGYGERDYNHLMAACKEVDMFGRSERLPFTRKSNF